MERKRTLRKTAAASSEFGHGTANVRYPARYVVLDAAGVALATLTCEKVGYMETATWELREINLAGQPLGRVKYGAFADLKRIALLTNFPATVPAPFDPWADVAKADAIACAHEDFEENADGDRKCRGCGLTMTFAEMFPDSEPATAKEERQ